MPEEESTSGNTSSGQNVEVRRRRRKRRLASPDKVVSSQLQKAAVSPLPKRRSRRSSQPTSQPTEKFSGSSRKVLFVIVSMAIIGGFLLTLAYSYTVAYHNSDSFKKRLEATSSNKTGAETVIKKLEVGPNQSSAKSVSWQWPSEGLMLRSLELEKLSSEYSLSSLLSFNWIPSQLTAEKGRVSIDTAKLAPQDFYSSIGRSIERLHCKSLDVFNGDSDRAWAKGLVATLHSNSYEKRLLLSEGIIQEGFLEGYKIKQGLVGVNQGAFKVSVRFESADISRGADAMALKGVVTSAEQADFDMTLEGVPSKRVLGAVLAKYFVGDISSKIGELKFSGTENYEIKLSASSDSIQLRDFECFDVISSILGKQSYRRPICTTGASFRFVKDGDSLSIDDLDLEEKDYLKVRGSLVLDESGRLSGDLTVGLPVSLSDVLEREFSTNAFTRESHGYLWESVEVRSEEGGVRDDLRSKLQSNAGRLTDDSELTPDKLFDQLISQ